MKAMLAAAAVLIVALAWRVGVADAQAQRVGEPLAGISSFDLEEFRLGLDDFLEVETAEEGLGPAFNGTSCAVCHNVPVVGGGGIIAEIRAAGRDSSGRPVPLSPDGETLFQLFSTTRYRAIVDGEEVGSDVTADGDTPLDVWIDDDGRLRRIEVAGLRLDLFDYGVPVEIEVPTDLGSDEDAESWFGMSQPTPTDEWEVQAEGTSGGSAWAVWAAPHELDGTAFTCRTLELGDDAEGWGGIAPEVDAFMPNHDGVLAACGYSSWFGTPTTNDPSVQVLQTQGMGAVGDPGSLVAFAVDDRWQGGPVRLVRDGADDVVLDVDGSGVAVWQPEGSAPITEVWVGDDAVRCEVVDFEDLMGDAMDASEEPPEEDLPEGELPDELLPDGMAWLTPIYVSACVRA